MKTRISQILLLLAIILTTNAYTSFSRPLAPYQISHQVSGKVVDKKGESLIGVSVLEKGTKNGTSTDLNGNFRLQLSNPQAVLVVSYVSFISREIPVNGQATVTITLMEDQKSLDEVVVIGYGTQKRKSLSTSISSVSSDQLKNISVPNPAQALAGQISGINITQTGGQPGAAPVIRIRGIGSLSAGNSPLYVVDGYPLANADDFNQINPSDIQTIDVLKDAAAAAIYGSRGGNGVIIVSTKRGRSGATKLSYGQYTGFQQLTKKIKLMDSRQFIDYSKESAQNAGLAYYGFYDNPPADLPNTDWQDEIYRRALITQHEISASGGSEKLTFNISAAYLKQNGILRNTSFERFNFRSNLDAQLSKKLKLGVSLATSLSNTQYQSSAGTNEAGNIAVGTDPVSAALNMPSVFPVRLPNGDFANTGNYPLTQGASSISPNFRGPTVQLDLYQDKGYAPRILGNTYLEYEIIQDLKFKTTFGAEYMEDTRNQFVPATMPSNTSPTANLSNPLSAAIAAAKRINGSTNWLSENTMTYHKIFGKHSIGLLAGYSAQSAVSTSNVITGVSGSFINDLIRNINGAGQTVATNTYSKNTLISALARINYSYQDKYIASAAIRRDGSSRFGSDKTYATFPSASLAWRITGEEFMKELKSISELKIRGSYGVTGNNNIGNYAAQSYASPYNYVFGSGSGSRAYGYAASNIANNTLTWEENRQVDLGIELGLWNDKLYLTADYYHRSSGGLLNNRNVPAIVGTAGSVLQNIGKITNQGFELGLTTQMEKGDFTWKANANLSFNKNKVVSLVNDNPIYFSNGGFTNYVIIKPGLALGDFYGYRQIGVFKDQADVNNGAQWASGGSKPGDIKYEDLNKDGKIDASDMTTLGNPLPKFTYGFVNNFKYKNFDLNLILQGSQGNQIVAQWLRTSYYFNGNANTIAAVANRWKSAEESGDGWQPRVSNTASGGANNFSSRYVMDGSFLRIRTLTIGYNLATVLAQKLKLSSIRIYLSGQNLYTFTKYIGYNPEVNDNGNTTSPTYGYDSASYPLARTFTAGLNLGF